MTSERLHESFLNFHCLIKREQELHKSWQASVYMRVFSTFVAWSNENKSCMRVDKREFAWEFCQLSLLDQESWQAWELTSESLHESFVNFHCLIKREQELHESWQARVCMRVLSTFIVWSNENKSCMRVDKREFTSEFSPLSLLDQTRTRVAWELTSESLHESFANFHCLIKREQENLCHTVDTSPNLPFYKRKNLAHSIPLVLHLFPSSHQLFHHCIPLYNDVYWFPLEEFIKSSMFDCSNRKSDFHRYVHTGWDQLFSPEVQWGSSLILPVLLQEET